MHQAANRGLAFIKTVVISAILGALVLPSTAMAQKGKDEGGTIYNPVSSYRVEAHSVFSVDLNLCAAPVVIDVRGDGDTDVDFTIYDENGRQVYQDIDLDDITTATLSPNVRNGNCVIYRMELNNLGNVWNQVQVTVGSDVAAGVAPSVGTYRVEANSEFWVDLTLCHPRARIEAHGDGDTDVDYTLYDRNNNVLHQDLALHDRTDVTFNTGSRDGSCYLFRLKLNNLGDVWNQVTVLVYDLE
jgi:hypothetical protein